MDKSKSVLQEIATLIHIYKSMASDTILDREISEEITARYDAEGGTLKASKPKYGYDINKHMRSMFNKFMNKEIKPYVYPWQEGDSNKSVLLPLFNDKNDKVVIKIFKKFFKTRKIIGIDCTNLIWGFGAIHCMTQSEPSV